MNDKSAPVLIAADLSAQAPLVVMEGIRIAAEENRPAVILHVVDDRFPYPDLFSLDHPDSSFYTTIRENAMSHLKKWVADVHFSGPVEYVIARGKPSSTIIDVAGNRKPRLLVVGAHGLSGRKHSHRLGSTAERAARECPCSILIVVAPAE